MSSILKELIAVAEPVRENKYNITETLEEVMLLESAGFTEASKELMAKAKTKERLGRLSELKYVKITDLMIQNFLDRKAAEYDKTAPNSVPRTATELQAYQNYGQTISFSRLSNSNEWSGDTYITPDSGFVAGGTTLSNTATEYFDQAILNRLRPHLYFDGMGSIAYVDERLPLMAKTKHYVSTAPGQIGQYKWVEDKIEELMKLPPMRVLKRLVEEKGKNLFDYFTVARLAELPDPLLLGRINGVNDRFFIAQWDNDICLDDLL